MRICQVVKFILLVGISIRHITFSVGYLDRVIFIEPCSFMFPEITDLQLYFVLFRPNAELYHLLSSISGFLFFHGYGQVN